MLQLSLPYGHLNPQGRCPPVTLPHNQVVPSPATPGPTTKKGGVLGTHLLTAVDSKSATQVTGKQVTELLPQVARAKSLPNPGAKLGWTLPTISKTTLTRRLRVQAFQLTGFDG